MCHITEWRCLRKQPVVTVAAMANQSYAALRTVQGPLSPPKNETNMKVSAVGSCCAWPLPRTQPFVPEMENHFLVTNQFHSIAATAVAANRVHKKTVAQVEMSNEVEKEQ